MKNVIARVFPRTQHRYYLWHILKKIPNKFKLYSNYCAIKNIIHKCVYESQTCGDFKVGRQSLLDSYKLKDHDWLRQLYNERTFWIPAYLKGVFWHGMRTTKWSECINAFFDGCVKPSTTLKQFVDQYDLALQKKVENDTLADFNSFNSKLPCITFLPFGEKFQKVYTIAKFKEVQHEVISRIYCTVSILTKKGAICTYQVIEQVRVNNGDVESAYVKVVTYAVYFIEDFNEDELEVKCTYDSFESRGILCIYALLY